MPKFRPKFDFGKTIPLPLSHCAECQHPMDVAAGPRTPHAGDWVLCVECGSLNVFTESLELGPPSDQDLFEAATHEGIQAARRSILELRDQRRARGEKLKHKKDSKPNNS